MRKTIVGTLIFSLALFAGIQATALIGNISAHFSLPTDQPEFDPLYTEERSPLAPVGVRISYIGINKTTLRFIIYNGSEKTLSCLGYAGICASPKLSINEADVSAWVCMNGSSKYQIRPGATAVMMVSPADFARVPGKYDRVVVGFTSVDENAEDLYLAEPIFIPATFRKQIIESRSRQGE